MNIKTLMFTLILIGCSPSEKELNLTADKTRIKVCSPIGEFVSLPIYDWNTGSPSKYGYKLATQCDPNKKVEISIERNNCYNQAPYEVIITNTTDRSIKNTTINIEAYEPGISTNVLENDTRYMEIVSPFIIKSNEFSKSCTAIYYGTEYKENKIDYDLKVLGAKYLDNLDAYSKIPKMLPASYKVKIKIVNVEFYSSDKEIP
jgi:hypothetical protein